MSIRDNIEQVRHNIRAACERSGRDESDITLLAVTKFVETERIQEAVDAGVRFVGENRAQEFTEKLTFYKQNDLHAHFIGQLQTNKVKYICGSAELIQSVDRIALLDAIAKQAERLQIVQDILLEVNIGNEPQKGGIEPQAVSELLIYSRKYPSVRVRGLMCVPPIGTEQEVRGYFQRMRALFEVIRREFSDLPMDTLSMGMSHDYAIAIEEGATVVRVGSAIFGARKFMGGK